MRTWQAFLEFQNAVPYGTEGVPAGSGRTEELRYVIDVPPNGNSLIIGPGGPPEVDAMRPHLPRGSVYTLSAHEPEYLAIASGCGWTNPALGDMHDMPFHDSMFDFIFCSNVGEHAVSPIVMLMECRRVLAPGGKAHFILPSFEGLEGGVGPFHWFCMSEDCWRELMRKCGLAVTGTEVEPGAGGANTGFYTHYRCVSGDLPRPYDRLLERVKELRK